VPRRHPPPAPPFQGGEEEADRLELNVRNGWKADIRLATLRPLARLASPRPMGRFYSLLTISADPPGWRCHRVLAGTI
jgi:hypothetical protein